MPSIPCGNVRVVVLEFLVGVLSSDLCVYTTPGTRPEHAQHTPGTCPEHARNTCDLRPELTEGIASGSRAATNQLTLRVMFCVYRVSGRGTRETRSERFHCILGKRV